MVFEFDMKSDNSVIMIQWPQFLDSCGWCGVCFACVAGLSCFVAAGH